MIEIKREHHVHLAGHVAIPGRGDIDYHVEFKTGLQRVSFHVHVASRQIMVRAPLGMTTAEIEAILLRHRRWLQNRLLVANQEPQLLLVDGSTLPFMGFLLTIQRLFSQGTPKVKLVANHTIHLLGHWPSPESTQGLDILRLWYRQQARHYLWERLNYWSQKMGIVFVKLTIRSQKSRWGSCSSLGNISLNWRVIFGSPEVIDYLLVHELAHRIHPNHSPAFWHLVAQYISGYLRLRQALKLLRPPL